MAIKKLTFDNGVLVSEETVDKPKRPAAPPERPAASRTGKSGTRTSGGGNERPRAKAVRIAAKGESGSRAKPGKSVIEQDVIKFRCPRCSSERVADSKEAELTCGLCGARMKLVH